MGVWERLRRPPNLPAEDDCVRPVIEGDDMAVGSIKSRPTGAGQVLRKMRKEWSAYLFLAPSLLQFTVLLAFPVIFSFYLSFHEWNILEPAKPYVGLDNY